MFLVCSPASLLFSLAFPSQLSSLFSIKSRPFICVGGSLPRAASGSTLADNDEMGHDWTAVHRSFCFLRLHDTSISPRPTYSSGITIISSTISSHATQK